jgi:hypothetical protein
MNWTVKSSDEWLFTWISESQTNSRSHQSKTECTLNGVTEDMTRIGVQKAKPHYRLLNCCTSACAEELISLP